MLNKLSFALAFALLVSASAFAQQETPLVTKSEDQWITVLGSNAPLKDKADACRELAVLGTQKSVVPLTALLADEKLNHMARYALETISDPSVNEALRNSLSKLSGRPLVGVIGSLGVRHDLQADKVLAPFLENSDPEVAQATAKSLGRIATPGAIEALKTALPKAASVGNQNAICEGLFRAAEKLRADKQAKDAAEIYDLVRATPKAQQQVRVAALRGAILSREKAGLPIMLEAIRGDDYLLTAAATRTSLEMSGADVTKALVGELATLQSVDKKVLIIRTLAKRGDASAINPLFKVAKEGDKVVRVAALKAIPEFKRASLKARTSAANKLADLLTDSEREVAQAALESLAALPGSEIDSFALTLLARDNAAVRASAAELIGRRRMTDAVPALLKASTDVDAGVRSAALRNVGELAGGADLPAMLDALASAKGSELEPITQALITACNRIGNPDACADALISRSAALDSAQQGSVLRILSRIGGPKALKAVRDGLANSNAEIHTAALRSLASWDNTDAAPVLIETIKSSSSADRATAFDGALRLCSESDAPADQRFQLISQIAGLAKDLKEKKQFLGELGGIPNVPALQLASKYLSDTELAEVAATAAVKISAKLDASKKADIAPVLKEVVKTAKEQATLDQARKVMKKFNIE